MRNRIILFLLTLIMFSNITWADTQTVTIGSGTSDGYFYGYGGCSYSTTQTIYTADEIGKEGYITSFAFNIAEASNHTPTKLEVYMGLTSLDEFGNTSDCLTKDDLTLVYSGSPTLGRTTGWEELALQTKFLYNGLSNLVVVICRDSYSSNSASPDCYYTYGSGKSRNINRWDCGQEGSVYADPDNTEGYSLSTSRNDIRFKIETLPQFAENNIRYSVTDDIDKTVSVIANSYSGIVSVPATVTHDGITYSVTGIGKNAFNGSSVSYVSLGANIKSIGDYAFHNCTSLTNVKMPASLTSIGSYAFYNCSACNFSKITLPEGFTSIGSYAFYNCDKLTGISLPSTVSVINDYTFDGCDNLAEVTLPDNLTKIGECSFRYCSKLTHIDIPQSTTTIGQRAFGACGLTSLVVPNTVTSIGDYAFSCTSLKEVTIDSPILEKDYTRSTYSSKTLCNIFGTDVEKFIIGDTPTRIGNYAFYCNYSSGNANLKEIVIGKNISEIGDYAFSSCNNIEKVYYNSVEQICGINFVSSSSSPNAHIYIDGELLAGELIVPDNVSTIKAYAFYSNKDITSVVVGKNVVSIGDDAFYRCPNIIKVTIDSPSLLEQTYTSSSNLRRKFDYFGEVLKEVVIGNTPTKVGAYAFSGGSTIESVTIGKNITTIDRYAFSGCSSFTSISIPSSVTRINESAFYGCTGLTKANFESVEALCKIEFPGKTSGWSSNEASANPLYNAKHLYINGTEVTDVVIPNGITKLYDHVFTNAENLKSFDIPMSVTSIGYGTFYGCSNLDDIYVHWQYPPTVNHYDGKYGNLHVPIGMKDNYSSKAYWKSFTIIDDVDYATVRDIRFSEMSYRCEVGDIGEMAYTLYPSNALIKDVTITTDGSSAIFFDNNTLQFVGLEDGVATITITSKDKDAFSKSVKIYVGNVPAEDAISLNTPSAEIRIGHNLTLTATQQTSNAIDKPITWTSSNTAVATISNGVVTAHSVGSTRISASIGNGVEATCDVTVFALSESLTDGANYTNDELKECDELTFSKTFSASTAGNWNALYVPMSINVEEYEGELDFAKIYAFCATTDTNGDGVVDAEDENFLFVKPVTIGSTKPNTPYLVRPKEAKTYVINSADNVLYPRTEGKVTFSTTEDAYTVTGLNEAFTVTAGDNNYYMSATGRLNKRTSGSTNVKANRWIMHRESKNEYNVGGSKEANVRAYRVLTIGEDIDESTAIAMIKLDTSANADIFTLDGRKVLNTGNLLPGIYIRQGKKFIIK